MNLCQDPLNLSPEQAEAVVRLASFLDSGELARRLAQDGPLKARSWLDGQFPVETSTALLDCATCQSHFVGKLEGADRWLLTRTAAAQATASTLARWRAGYLRERFPQADTLVELGTGIGGDTVYLARHFSVQGYEQDAARATLALANVRRLSPQARPCTVVNRSVAVSTLSGSLLFADPARRGQTRTFNPEDWDPPLSQLLAHRGFNGMVVKTAPGLDLQCVPEGTEVHFLSLAGELKEAMLLSGATSSADRHAWLWPVGAVQPLHRCGESANLVTREPKVGEFLHNPDPAALRAGLLSQLANELEAGLVHPKIGYLCGPLPSPDEWADSFAIQESLPLAWKRVQAVLLTTDWSDFEYLARGVPFSQADVMERTKSVRKRMKGRSGGRGALVIYRDRSDYRVVLAMRCQATTKDRESFPAVER